MPSRLDAVLRIGHARSVVDTGMEAGMEEDSKKLVTLLVFPGADLQNPGGVIQTFEVQREAAELWVTVANMLQDAVIAPIPIPHQQNTKAMQQVIEYTNYYLANGKEATKRHSDKFFSEFSHMELFALLNLANYLDFDDLVNDACRRVAKLMQGKTPAQIRQEFQIPDDEFTPEELEEINRENKFKAHETTTESGSGSGSGSSGAGPSNA